MSDTTTKVGVGNYTIGLSEDILKRMLMLSECTYMEEDLNRIIERIIELYEGDFDFGDIIPAEDAMRMIATLHEVRKDYRFLTSLSVAETPTPRETPSSEER